MKDNQNREMTVAQIFKQVFKHKILIIVATLVVAILGTVMFGILPNKTDRSYVSNFSITLPTTSAFNMPKGQESDYMDIISLENLNAVKESKEKYKDIDVKKIDQVKAMSIIKERNKETGEVKYSINVNAVYFEDINIASEFINDLIENVFNASSIVDQARLNYNSYYQSQLTFDAKLTLFRNRLGEMKTSYDEAIKSFGDIVVNGKTLSTHRQEVINILGGVELLRLENIQSVNAYSPVNPQLVAYYESQAQSYNLTKTNNLRTIEELKAQLVGADANAVEPTYAKIAELVEENSSIDEELSNIATKIVYAKGENLTEEQITGVNAFSTDIQAFDEIVEDLNDKYFDNAKAFYEQAIEVEFENSAPVSVAGEKNVIVMAIISAILGFALGCVISYVIEVVKKPKEENQDKEIATDTKSE